MSVTGPGGVSRPDFGTADTTELEAAKKGIEAARPERGWFFDGSSSTQKLATSLVRDGKFDKKDAEALLRDAKDFGAVTNAEKQVFVSLIREHGSKITPAMRWPSRSSTSRRRSWASRSPTW